MATDLGQARMVIFTLDSSLNIVSVSGDLVKFLSISYDTQLWHLFAKAHNLHRLTFLTRNNHTVHAIPSGPFLEFSWFLKGFCFLRPQFLNFPPFSWSFLNFSPIFLVPCIAWQQYLHILLSNLIHHHISSFMMQMCIQCYICCVEWPGLKNLA